MLAARLARDAVPARPASPPPPPEIVARAVTLEERAAVIRRALRSAPQIVLQDLLRDVHDRVVVAVTFLAMLELAKGREVSHRAGRSRGARSVCRARSTAAARRAVEIDASETSRRVVTEVEPRPICRRRRAQRVDGDRAADVAEPVGVASSRRCSSSPSGR